MMQIHHTSNGLTNKIVFALLVGFGVYTIIIFATSCNSSRRNRTNEAYVIKQDSSAAKDSARVVKVDSAASREETETLKSYYDSSLQLALEVAISNNLDYANQAGAFDKLQPIIIKNLGDTAFSIDAGGRNVTGVKLQQNRNHVKADSTSKKSTAKADLKKLDSSSLQQAAIIHHEEKKEVRSMHVEKKKTPWYLYAGAMALLAGGLAYYIIRKKAKGIKKVGELFT